jgi:hypothetical protein
MASKPLMDEHRTDDGTENIEAAVERITGKGAVHVHTMEDEAENGHRQTGDDWVEHHRLEVPPQTLLCLRTDTGHSDADELHELAIADGVEDLEAVEHIKDKADHRIGGRDGQVHHDLDDKDHVDARTEHAVHLLLFTGFFHKASPPTPPQKGGE